MAKEAKIIVEYDSNNSGGSWWLDEKDWKALEKAGWKIKWGRGDFKYKNGNYTYDKEGYPVFKKSKKTWLGSIAQRAWLKCKNKEEARTSFEKATGQNPDEEGCNCCGQPHNFSVLN